MRIIRLKDVIERTGLARSTIYQHVANGTFPTPVPLGDRAVGWVEREVQDWIMARIAQRDAGGRHPLVPAPALAQKGAASLAGR